MAHSYAAHNRDHHHHAEGASPLRYKGRGHWPQLKFNLEMHFDSHGLQGLIIRGLITRPTGGFITSNINPITMSVINTGLRTPGSDSELRGVTTTNTTRTGAAPTTGSDETEPQESKATEALQAQITALTGLTTQLTSDITTALSGESQQEAQATLLSAVQQLQQSINSITTQPITTATIGEGGQLSLGDGSGDTSLLEDLEGAAKNQLTKIKLIRSLSEECTLDTYVGFEDRLKKALWDYATRKIYDTIAKSLGFKYRGIIRGITQGDGHSAWGKLVLHHNNKTASTMSGYLKQYQNEQQDNAEGPRFFADYAQSLSDISEMYHEASNRKKSISEELRRSRYLQLAERYGHIVETIETEDDKRMEQDEELQTADEIETLIRRWEQRKLPVLEKQMAAIRKKLRKGHENHAYNANQGKQPCFNFRRDGTCKFGDNCRYSHDINPKGEKPPRRPFGPCPICQDKNTKPEDWHWKSDCPEKNGKQDTRSADKKGQAAAARADGDSDSDDDTAVDWKARYLEAREHVLAEKRAKEHKHTAASAWDTKVKNSKRRSKR